MRGRSPLLIVVVAFAVLIACPAAAQATRGDMIVSTDWLAERIGGQVVLIEIGDKGDYDRGHIPSARLMERRELLVDIDRVPNEIPPLSDLEWVLTRLGAGEETRLVFYSLDPLLATRAWFTLDYLGHGYRTSVLNGGYARWVEEGRSITAEVPAFQPAVFTPHPNAGSLTTLKAMTVMVRSRAALGTSLVVIDARPAASYRGDFAGAGVDRAGHIPGAINVPWQQNLTGASNVFRSDDELRTMYERLGVVRGTTVITYCRTGVEASMTYFVLRYLGLDPTLYDGSFVEWSRDEGTPVV